MQAPKTARVLVVTDQAIATPGLLRVLRERAARAPARFRVPVRGRVSIRHDPMAAVEEQLHDEPFDEIILAVSSRHLDRLAHRIEHLGLPVTTVRDAA